MTPSNHSTLQVSLLDRIYSSLFARLTPRGEAMTPEQCNELLRELRPDTLFQEMERWIGLFDRDWLKRLKQRLASIPNQ